MSVEERAEREREQYNAGLQRDRYERVLQHCRSHSGVDEIIRDEMKFAEGKTVLGMGSMSWKRWLEDNQIYPETLYAINYSEREIDKGEEAAKSTVIKPIFKMMDAHHLEFADDTFDFVFGGAMLHHLDLPVVLSEIQRVLKPGGRMMFYEPLGINPVSKLVRFFTPKARTVDEQPFRFKELKVLNEYFDIKLHPFQFMAVPFGVVSGLMFRNPENFLTFGAAKFDRVLAKAIPPTGYFYRHVLVVGTCR